ncbi:hypothetical protein LTR56_000112 [Elasticomyces elasticus]|nr:hypothetical protein LTR56_000112 [Elasticomyces elasticus]KAK3667100.1 hypothetical protein LTR22_001964 [Elasticomyces elasticus]KAK4932875.1 hypothetical protein LTR49_000831 [Elasticomyces elasticus]KAK5768721.1 hypothetical protein LTS12_001147 [Elasticomyces elasticus]
MKSIVRSDSSGRKKNGTAESNILSKPLLELLPAELWSRIGKEVIDITPFCTSDRKFRIVPQPPITRVCRAFREELLPYFCRTKFKPRLSSPDKDVENAEFASIEIISKEEGVAGPLGIYFLMMPDNRRWDKVCVLETYGAWSKKCRFDDNFLAWVMAGVAAHGDTGSDDDSD